MIQIRIFCLLRKYILKKIIIVIFLELALCFLQKFGFFCEAIEQRKITKWNNHFFLCNLNFVPLFATLFVRKFIWLKKQNSQEHLQYRLSFQRKKKLHFKSYNYFFLCTKGNNWLYSLGKFFQEIYANLSEHEKTVMNKNKDNSSTSFALYGA